jgi:hypothetical protein
VRAGNVIPVSAELIAARETPASIFGNYFSLVSFDSATDTGD